MKYVLVGLLCFAGCSDPFKSPDVAVLQNDMAVVLNAVDDMQDLVSKHAERLVAADLIDAGTAEKLAGFSKEIDRVQPAIVEMTAAIADVNYTGDDLGDILAALQAANRASAGYNPYAVPIEAGLGLATVLAGLFGLKKRDDAKVMTAKYRAHKVGVESVTRKLTAEGDTKVASKLYDAIGDARKGLGI